MKRRLTSFSSSGQLHSSRAKTDSSVDAATVGKAVTTGALVLLLVVLLLTGLTVTRPAHGSQGAVVTPLMSRDLKEFPGKEATMLTVEYPPGSTDPVHRHNAHGFIYVLEGSIIMQVKGGPLTTVPAGQTFYEGPDDVHVVGRNASDTKRARFVVFFVKDKGAPILTPVASDGKQPTNPTAAASR
jgi:quercetin dioxygenase-like cupin family protein